MVDFRRCITVFAMLALFAGLAAAQGAGSQTPLTCSTNVTATPQLRAEGYTENTGDITITCTGGPTATVGQAITQVNITVVLNTQVTSRLLNTSFSNASEALLLIDEPGSLSLPAAVGPGQPFGPQATQNICGTPLTGCAEVVSSTVCTTNPALGAPAACAPGIPAATVINVATDAAQGTTATTNGKNVFQGIWSGTNQITWFGVPVLAPGSTGITRTFRFTNIRANANALSGGAAAGATPVVAQILVSNTAALPITNPTPTVGFVQQGLTTASSNGGSLQQCVSRTKTFVSTLTFKEGFGTAFKTRVATTGASVTQYAGQSYTGALQQNIPGSVYNSESNFIQPAVTGGTTNTAGLADWGTRLKATFTNIPTGTRLFVSVNNVLNGNAGVATAPSPVGDGETLSYAQLISGETIVDGTAGSSFFPGLTASTNATSSASTNIGLAELAITSGTATAVWEVLNTNPSAIDTLYFGVYTTFVATPGSGLPSATGPAAQVALSFAPSPPAITSGSVASTANVPRFALGAGTAASNIFAISICRTILLYPFVTNTSGFDTGLAIANTSTDPFGTSPQNGTCALNWYGNLPEPPTNSGNVASGTVYTTLASVAVPGFQGYMIAICQFQFAHGFAFISDLGARNLAMGYLAVVIPDPTTQANSVRNASMSGCGTGDITCGAGEGDGH